MEILLSTHDWDTVQIIKARDDYSPVILEKESEPRDGEPIFRLADDSTASWITHEDSLDPPRLRSRLEPWLTSLFQSDHLSLLVGSGLTTALHVRTTGSQPPGMEKADFTTLADAIEDEVAESAKAAGRGEGNIEDQIRVVTELIQGLSVLVRADNSLTSSLEALRHELKATLEKFANSILTTEKALITAESSKQEESFHYLVSFLMSFASRTGSRDRLRLFTTNYDRLIETGSELAGIHLLDRFVGSISPVMRSSRLNVDMHYNPPGIRGEPRYLEGVVRFTKLHGSVDWIETNGTIRRIGLPFGATGLDSFLSRMESEKITANELLIYPNSAKERESASYPYVELFRDFAAAVCRPHSTLVTYGYSFGDEHINRAIQDMLTIPSTHLVIISYDDPLKRIMRFYDQTGRHEQITLLLGHHVANLTALVDYYLPKAAIDRTSTRMADLLKARWGTTANNTVQSDVNGSETQ